MKGFRGRWGEGPIHGIVIVPTTIDLYQTAAAYTLFTGTKQDVWLEGLVIRLPNVNVSDDATITSISIHTDDTTPNIFITTTQGAKANLTAEKQISWTGAALIKVGKTVKLTIAGGASDAATICDAVALCRATKAGGYLAV